jgi:hypothetical protein
MTTQTRRMTTQTRRVRVPIVGEPDHLENALRTAHRQGRLVPGTVTSPRKVAEGRYMVTAVMLETTPLRPAQSPTRRRMVRRRYRAVAVAATAAVATLAALRALALAVSWVAAHVGLVTGICLAVAALAWLLREKGGH